MMLVYVKKMRSTMSCMMTRGCCFWILLKVRRSRFPVSE